MNFQVLGRVVTRYMGSGIKGLNRGGIRDHSPGIWDHNPWDRDQQCLHGIRDHSVLHNNKNPIKLTKRAFQALSGIFKVLVLFSNFVFHGIYITWIHDRTYWLRSCNPSITFLEFDSLMLHGA